MDKLRKHLTCALEAHLAGEPLRLPDGGAVLWNAFTSLSHARSQGASGPNPIAPSEIESWMRLMRMPLEPRHVAIVMDLDRIWMRHTYRMKRAPDGTGTLPQRSEHALTPKLFDLLG